MCHFVLVFFCPFSIAITSLGEERANLMLFVCLIDLRLFGFVGFLFLLMSGKGCCDCGTPWTFLLPIFQYICNFRSQITYSYMKCGCSNYYFFLSSVNLICRSMDISKYFRESLGL